MQLWLASAFNERQIPYFTYIHERGTEPHYYTFLFVSIRLHACCITILSPVHFPCMFSMFKSASGYFVSHTFISEHWLGYTFPTHLPIYCYLEVHMRGSQETLFCRLLFCSIILI